MQRKKKNNSREGKGQLRLQNISFDDHIHIIVTKTSKQLYLERQGDKNDS